MSIKVDIKIPVLKARVVLLLGGFDEIKNKIPYGIKHFGESGYLGRTVYKRREGRLPFCAVIHSRSAAISVIAHEAVHAASFILDEMGVVADFDNDELQAYLVQYICEKAEVALRAYE